MRIDLLVMAAVSLGVGVTTAVFYVALFLRPDIVWMINAPTNIQLGWPDSMRRRGRWYHVAFVIVAMIGTGVCVGAGLTDLLSWMPKSWRSDTGVWMAESVASLTAILVAFALPIGAVQMSSNLGQHKEEVEELKALVRRLREERP